MAQEWILRRFAELKPRNFNDGIFIFDFWGLEPPPFFRDVWASFEANAPIVLPPMIQEVDAILFLCSPLDQTQLRVLRYVLATLNERDDIPPLFWLPHTVAPEERPPQAYIDLSTNDFCINIMECGLDDIIDDEPEGFNLVIAVRTRVQKSKALSKMLNDVVEERRMQAEKAEFLQNTIHDILWCHLRGRCAMSVPLVDPSLPNGEVRAVPGYNFGKRLGNGSFCTVFALEPVAGNNVAPNDEVIKMVNKSHLKEPEQVKQIGHMVNVMLLLSQGWTHPNITQLRGIYHSPSHIFFRETYGGSENLFSLLSHCQSFDKDYHPMTAWRATQLIVQLSDVIAFIHTGPHICHLDIKPENIIINETPEALNIKLTDFDLAVIQKDNRLCRKPCGTLPFIAPEVLLASGYDGMAADMWSYGMVLFEIQCGIRIIDKMVCFRKPQARGMNNESRKQMGSKIKACFEQPGSSSTLLDAHCQDEVRSLLPVLAQVFDGILNVIPDQRFNAQKTNDILAILQESG